MSIADFLPTYTEFDIDIKYILGDLVDEIPLFYKKEFNDYKLEKTEIPPTKSGEYMNHQNILARFLNSNTPYKGILVMHEPGTGKTCLSVAVIEKVIKDPKSTIKRALILMKGENLISNYKRELVDKCTNDTYTIEDDDKKIGYKDDTELTKTKVNIRINKKLKDFYDFRTFIAFSNSLERMSDENIRDEYSNLVIVIDEAHHLHIKESKKNAYSQIYRMLHLVKNCKVILMTGTPMVDSPSEIASLMNLILDSDRQLPTGEEFKKRYMTKLGNDLVLNPEREEELKQILYGKVSFLRMMRTDTKKEFIGELLDLKYMKQLYLKLKEPQKRIYLDVLEKDRMDKDKVSAFYTNASQAALFVFPNETIGEKGYTEYYKGKKSLIKDSKKEDSNEMKLQKLEKYSIKYATCIRLLLSNEGSHFVYMNSAHEGGAIIFSKLLEEFGFMSFKKGYSERTYALLTSDTANDIDKAIKVFNGEENVSGKKIKVIIGTEIISEGFTFKNVKNVHILTPHWNFSQIDQAIARAFRLSSHQLDVTVNIYLYTIIVDDEKTEDERDKNKLGKFKSIDRYKYLTCEDKDISIKSVEYLLKLVSFDCMLTKKRNVLDMDGLRECEYRDCDYECYDEMEQKEIDYSTYNLFYDKDDIEKMVEKLKAKFLLKSVYTLDELKMSSDFLVVKTILYCIENNVLFVKNKMNFFLKHENDLVFLSSFKNDCVLDSFYVDYIPLELEFNFDKKVEIELFNKLKNERESEKDKIFDFFDKETKNLMYETAVISREKGLQIEEKCSLLRDYILKHKIYEKYVTVKDDLIIFDFVKYRCFDKKEMVWSDCDSDIIKEIKDKYEKEKEEKMKKYGLIGLFVDDEFKILKKEVVNKQTKEGKTDNRGKPRGQVCNTMPEIELLSIIHKLKIEPIHKVEIKEDEFKEFKKSKLFKEFKTLVGDVTEKDSLRIYGWVKKEKNKKSKDKKSGKYDMCEQIKKTIREKEIFLEK